MHVANTKRR